MIEEVESLLQHWGERCRRGLNVSGGNSPLAAAMLYGGMIPSGGRGSMGLAGSVDLAAEEVDAALAVLKQAGQAEDAKLATAWSEAGQEGRPPFCLNTQLVKLAMVRYLTEPMPLVEHQMRRTKIASKRTYHDRVQQLHEKVQAELIRRAGMRPGKRAA